MRALTLLEDLELCKAIDKDMIRDLGDEWDEHKALSGGVDANTDVLSFFRDHQDSLPTFAEAAQLLAVMPSSSASAERVF